MIAQDLASWGLDRRAGASSSPLDVLDSPTPGSQPLVELVDAVAQVVERVRLLYLYPSGLTERLIDTVLATGVPYFDLSLQHASGPHLRRMRRWGNGDKFIDRIERIRSKEPSASFRSSFILGYPGETEDDHDQLIEFLEAAKLDWAGFFPFSKEDGTYAADLDDQVPAALALERLREVTELQDEISTRARESFVGQTLRVLIDEPGQARSVHEAPDIDGVIEVDPSLKVGSFVDVVISESLGTDLVGETLPREPKASR